MRTIKFRVWDKVHPERGMHQIKMDGYEAGDFFNNERFEVMQFTGLLDCNGKEIYEGDIVKWKWDNTEGIDQVMFGQYSDNEAYRVFTHIGWSVKKFYSLSDLAGTCEVVGNKFENRELLKE